MEHWWWNSVMKQWNSNGGTLGGGAQWNSKVEQCNGIVEQSWWNIVVEQWNIDGGKVWWNSRTVMVEQCCGTVQQSCWNSVVEH